jgi:hypothetical protein
MRLAKLPARLGKATRTEAVVRRNIHKFDTLECSRHGLVIRPEAALRCPGDGFAVAFVSAGVLH